MANETVRLAEYAAGLRYEDLPPDVMQRAKDCITDTVAVIVLGNAPAVEPDHRRLRATHRRRRTQPHPGRARADGAGAGRGFGQRHAGARVRVRQPDQARRRRASRRHVAAAGPGGGAGTRQFSGRELITAVVAGFEVMYRIGYATKHSNERRGFHAPGTTGPFGAAVAAGVLLGLDADRMTNALGIAGSLAGGLMEFARSGTGAMVKRLHLGRASESGVMAANLAADGFTGPTQRARRRGRIPESVLHRMGHGRPDARSGQRVHDDETVPEALSRAHDGANRRCRRCWNCRQEHGFAGADVDRVTVAGTERMATINNIRRSDRHHDGAVFDSVLCRSGVVPRSARSGVVRRLGADAMRRSAAMCARVSVVAANPPTKVAGASIVTIQLKDGRSLTREVEEFNGTPARPLDRQELRDKFMTLTRVRYGAAAAGLFERLQGLENETDLGWIGA